MTLKKLVSLLLLAALVAATSPTIAFGQPPQVPDQPVIEEPVEVPADNEQPPTSAPPSANQPEVSQEEPQAEPTPANEPVPTYRSYQPRHRPSATVHQPVVTKVIKVGDARSTINAALRTTRLRRDKKTGHYSVVAGSPETALLVETAMRKGYTEGIGGWRLALKADVTDEQCAALLNRQAYVVRNETRKLRETVSAMKTEVGQQSFRLDGHDKEFENLTKLGKDQAKRLDEQKQLIDQEIARAKKGEKGLGEDIADIRSQSNGQWWWLLLLTMGGLLMATVVAWMAYKLWELIRPKGGFSASTVIAGFKRKAPPKSGAEMTTTPISESKPMTASTHLPGPTTSPSKPTASATTPES